MKEKTIIQCIVGALAAALIFAFANTDLLYLGAAVLFFTLCIAYAEWCERL